MQDVLQTTKDQPHFEIGSLQIKFEKKSMPRCTIIFFGEREKPIWRNKM